VTKVCIHRDLFLSREKVRDAGATFALASTAGEATHDQVLAKEDATAATVVEEEQNEELYWAHEQTSRRSAYAFYIKCTGVAMACGLFALIAVWSGLGLFSMVYLSSA
jgi:hypothetical protein